MSANLEAVHLHPENVSVSRSSADHLDEENGSESVKPVTDAGTCVENSGLKGGEYMVSDGKYVEHATLDVKECVQEYKTEYKVNDLVWGKVSGHPWWPGQIFEPSAASRKAKKHCKIDNYLIAYFGDHTFAWNDASRIKPFRIHFEQLEKQSHSEIFCQALGSALDEVSRRVELGLSCPCLPNEVLTKIKTQTVVNRGVRKESSQRDGSDDLSTSSSFDPQLLIHHLKSLAITQCNDGGGCADRLGFVVTKAQLLAFNRWKGYDELATIRECGELLEINDDMSGMPSLTVEPKQHFEGNEFLQKKLKLEKSSWKTATLSSGNFKKRKENDQVEVNEVIKKFKHSNGGNNESKLSPKKLLFGIGERIQRAAIQLGGSSPVLKSHTELPPLNEVLSKLSSAATDPMNSNTLAGPFFSFFIDFRDSFLKLSDFRGHEKGSEKSEEPSGHVVMECDSEDPSGTVGKGDVEEESSPTALILNFRDSESVPLGGELNKAFSRFGPLDELLTEAKGKKRKSAKVVFKKRADAESAFSNADKFSTLGPSLISYRLNYLSKGRKSEGF
ncbi:unnamed protein product [Cuscuta europaea]|uniref:PWWP domain-containing protein n=1 Tax=Cuscuta europaea TaxID=41803 RepID=A0A9P0ZE22_CUSEU|nr:unnamed protein product [Cuscuta europaea]